MVGENRNLLGEDAFDATSDAPLKDELDQIVWPFDRPAPPMLSARMLA